MISKKHCKKQAVIDTSVLVRGLISVKSDSWQVVTKVVADEIQTYYSDSLLKEIARVFFYPRIYKKYHLTKIAIETYFKTLMTFGKIVFPTKKVSICRDKTDNELLSIALSIYQGEQIYLVTLDEDLLILNGKIKEIEILTPKAFLRSF